MEYKQLKSFNTSTVGQIGWCLKYGDDGFGIPARYPTAWDAWMQTDFPHNDRNIPQDVSVPLWFDYWESGIRYGHVVVNVPGKGLYSSPWKAGQTHAVLSSIAEVERIYGVVYVGWSEDISEVRVVKKEEDVSVTDLSLERQFAWGIGGRNGYDGTPNALMGESDDDLKKNHVGTETNKSARAWYDSQEGKNWREKRLPAMAKNDPAGFSKILSAGADLYTKDK